MTERHYRSEEFRTHFADAFETMTDPLKFDESTFEVLDADPFDLFITDALSAGTLSDRTINQYQIAYQQWREYMNEAGRHPACPNEKHVHGFAHWLQAERDNGATLL